MKKIAKLSKRLSKIIPAPISGRSFDVCILLIKYIRLNTIEAIKDANIIYVNRPDTA